MALSTDTFGVYGDDDDVEQFVATLQDAGFEVGPVDSETTDVGPDETVVAVKL